MTEAVILRSRRRTVAFRALPDGRLEVRAPLQMSGQEIRELMERHRRWIETHCARRAEAAARAEAPFTAEELSAMAGRLRRALPAYINEYAQRLGVRPARVTIRHQKTRWGSCSSTGSLSFNCLLALAPEPVCRYVCVHELCHLRHMDHSPAFWALVASVLPDYAAAKQWLKTEGQRLIDRG